MKTIYKFLVSGTKFLELVLEGEWPKCLPERFMFGEEIPQEIGESCLRKKCISHSGKHFLRSKSARTEDGAIEIEVVVFEQ